MPTFTSGELAAAMAWRRARLRQRRPAGASARARMVKRLTFAVAVLLSRLFAFQTGPVAPPRAAEPLPLTQIASREEELHKLLRDISRDLPLPSQLEEFGQQLTEQQEAVRSSLEQSAELL